MRRVRLLSIAVLTVAGSAWGQVGFNVDLNCQYCPPPLGGGSPSDSFGGENDIQRGFWNALPASGHGPIQLRDLKGSLTGVTATGNGSGVGGGVRFDANTDRDVAALQNDGHQVLSESIWIFDGLTPGKYTIVTYAAWPDDEQNATPVTVFGETKRVTGPMLANSFVEGVTHSRHQGWIDGRLVITVGRGDNHVGFINGFQLVPVVPEPTCMVALITGFAAFAHRCRRRRRC